MKELLKQFNLPNYLKGDSFAADSKRISKRVRGKDNEHSTPEDIATEQDLLGKLKEAQEFVKSAQEQVNAPQQNQFFLGGDPQAGTFSQMAQQQFGGVGQGAMGIAPEIADGGASSIADAASAAKPGIGGGISAAGDMAAGLVGSLDKQKSGYKNSGIQAASGFISGAAQGAQVGGLPGAIIGGVIKGGASFFGAEGHNRKQKVINRTGAYRQVGETSNFALGGNIDLNTSTGGKNIQNRFFNGGDPTKPGTNTANKVPSTDNVNLNGTVLNPEGQNALLQKQYQHNADSPYLGKYGQTYAGKDGMEAKGANIMSYDKGVVNFNKRYNNDMQEQYMDKVRGLPENKGRDIYLGGSTNPAYMAPRGYNSGRTTETVQNQFYNGGDPNDPPRKRGRFGTHQYNWADTVEDGVKALANALWGSKDDDEGKAETLEELRAKSILKDSKHADLFKAIRKKKQADDNVLKDNTKEYADTKKTVKDYFDNTELKTTNLSHTGPDKNTTSTDPATKKSESITTKPITTNDLLSFDEARAQTDGAGFLDYVKQNRSFNPDNAPRKMAQAITAPEARGLEAGFDGQFHEQSIPLTKADIPEAEAEGWWQGAKEGFDNLMDPENTTLAQMGRMAPSLMNAIQLANLKKPEIQSSPKLSGRIEGQRVDEESLQNLVREQNAGTKEAIRGSSGGSGSAARANLLAANRQGSGALSDAYLKATGMNMQEVARAQGLNREADMVNIRQSNIDTDANARNRGAYENNKAKLLTQIGQDIGNMSKEALYRKYPWLMGMDYDSKGKYIGNKKK